MTRGAPSPTSPRSPHSDPSSPRVLCTEPFTIDRGNNSAASAPGTAARGRRPKPRRLVDDERRRDKHELRQEERAADQRREDARHYAAQEQHNDQHLKDHREAIEREAHLELGSKAEGVEARFASSSHCHPPLAARSPASSRISPLIRFHPFPATQASPFTNGTRSL